jgi:hypothetical protein
MKKIYSSVHAAFGIALAFSGLSAFPQAAYSQEIVIYWHSDWDRGPGEEWGGESRLLKIPPMILKFRQRPVASCLATTDNLGRIRGILLQSDQVVL